MSESINVFKAVREFHEKMGLEVDVGFTNANETLRLKLLKEELDELKDEFYWEDQVPDHVNITKELADIVYVAVGAAVTWGLPLEEVFYRVHKSNLSKLDDDGKPIYREDGKVIKGPNYEPPNLENLF